MNRSPSAVILRYEGVARGCENDREKAKAAFKAIQPRYANTTAAKIRGRSYLCSGSAPGHVETRRRAYESKYCIPVAACFKRSREAARAALNLPASMRASISSMVELRDGKVESIGLWNGL